MSGSIVLLGSRKGLLIFEQKGEDWNFLRICHQGVPVSYATFDRRNHTLWACLDHGHWGAKLQRSSNLGETWEEVEAPKYPEDACLGEGMPGDTRNKPGESATLNYLWVLTPAGENQPNRIYVGTVPGGLFVSDDAGDSFQLAQSLWNHPSRLNHWFGGGFDQPGIHSILIDPVDEKRIFIGISCAGVFESMDEGVSWQPRNQGLNATFLPDPQANIGHDPHLLTQCLSHPHVMWQQNHCGIFRSEDYGQNWVDVSQKGGTAFFGFAIAADPNCGDTAWMVPAISDEVRMAVNGALCVCRTKDGGKSWEDLRKGLPQEHCYDLVLRHGLDFHDDKLVFGTTTGNVYVSHDRGDSWFSIGNHFPPVYSARFARVV